MTVTETSSTDVASGYQFEGTLLEVCSCETLCPCWIREDPDQGTCQSVVAYNLNKGTIRGVDVSGLTLVGVVDIPSNILEGNWQLVYVDDRASDEQAEALLDAFSGKLGGPLADLAQLVGDRIGVERVDQPRDRRRCRDAQDRRQGRLRDAPVPRPGRQHHHAQQLDLLDGAGLARVRPKADHQRIDIPSTTCSGRTRGRTHPVGLDDRLPGGRRRTLARVARSPYRAQGRCRGRSWRPSRLPGLPRSLPSSWGQRRSSTTTR